MSDPNKDKSSANTEEIAIENGIAQAWEETLENLSWALNINYKTENHIDDIEDIDHFLSAMLVKWLVGIPNFNNGTMYYVPEDAISYYTNVSRVWNIKLGNDDDISKGTQSFVKSLECMTTWEFWKIWVKTQEWDIELTGEETKPKNLFLTIEKIPWCIKLWWLNRVQNNIKLILFTMRDWKIKNISFTDSETWIPHDMSMYSIG